MPALLLYGWEVVTLPVKAKGFVPSNHGRGTVLARLFRPKLRAAREMKFTVNCCKAVFRVVVANSVCVRVCRF